MLAALAGTGWLLALGACIVSLALRGRLAERMELVARACHELRGSITAAHLGLRLADRSPARRRALELELGRAASAVEDLVGAFASRPLGRRLELLDAAELLADSVEAWQPAAADAGRTLKLSWSGAPASVAGDRYRLAQATGNLIANAIEHGEAEIHVLGRLDGAHVRLEVTDRGPGLPAPVRTLTRRARAGKGRRGRGLAIAAAVARDHGGRLAAAPSERGARVVLELPAAPAGDVAARAPLASGAR
jgi:signal transduction histidine kinase